MRIWVDADACPAVIRDLLVRAAQRRQVPVTFVANLSLQLPRSELITLIVVRDGADAADHHIAEFAAEGDLVVTADIPLAARVVERGGLAVNPRGELYTKHNIGARLQTRNLLDQLRAGGMETGGPAPFGRRDTQAFANQLDRLITKNHQSAGNDS